MRRGQLLQPEGLVPYMRAYEWMHEVAEQRARGDVPDTLILLEHPPTYTAGRRSDPAHLVWTRSQPYTASGTATATSSSRFHQRRATRMPSCRRTTKLSGGGSGLPSSRKYL